MINILIPLLIIIILILFKLFETPKEVMIVIFGLCLSGLSYYIAVSVDNSNISLIFMYLTPACIILIPILILYEYITKL